MSRAREALSEIPLSTFCFGNICVATYCFQIFANPRTHDFTMNPYRVLFMHEYYRIISSAFFHGNLMHIGMNMLSFMALGKSLEKCFGTLWITITILWSIVLTSSIEMLIAFAAYMIGSEDLMNQHSLGFSAVLFHLLTLESYRSPDSLQSIFGMMRVSSKYFPWAILVVTQILLPQASFLGHLSGIVCGILQSCGQLNIIMPSASFLRQCDDSRRLQFISCRESYVRTAFDDAFFVFSNSSSARSGIASVANIVCKFIRDLLETIKYMVFGRDGGGNQNIQLTEETVALNDSEWVGIPKVPSPKQMPSEAEMV